MPLVLLDLYALGLEPFFFLDKMKSNLNENKNKLL